MMYPILITSDRFVRKTLTDYLESRNIETRPMFPMLNQPVYRKMFGGIEESYPVAKRISRNGFYIGCHHELHEEELDYIGKTFKEFF
jgi:dTDP-4-amino-4,6-dideoxygalactose transaminase